MSADGAPKLRSVRELARRAVGDRRSRPPALLRQVREDFQVMIDLPVFVGHRDAHFARHVQHVQTLQPIVRRRIENARVPLVVFARRRFFGGRLVINEPRLAGRVGDELPVARRGAEQRAAKRPTELFAQPHRPLGDGRFFVTSRVAWRSVSERCGMPFNMMNRPRIFCGVSPVATGADRTSRAKVPCSPGFRPASRRFVRRGWLFELAQVAIS